MKRKRVIKAFTAVALTASLSFSPLLPTGNHQQAEAKMVQSQKDPFYVAGFTQKEFNSYFKKLQKAVSSNNKQAAAKLVHYPLNVNSNGKTKVIRTQKQFIKEYKTIMTSKVRKAVLTQKPSKVFVNYQGVRVGNGEVWISKFGKSLGIYGINK